MAVQLSPNDFTLKDLNTFPRNARKQSEGGSPRKGEGSQKTNKDISTCSLLYNASEANLKRCVSTTTSFPSVSDMESSAVVLPGGAGGGKYAAIPTSTHSPQHHLQQQPSTGQMEPRVIRRSRLSELMADVQNAEGLSETIRTHLAQAEEFILQKKNADAIPCLESALLATEDAPNLQCQLWRLLGNAHLSLSHYKKASVCHMHQLALCRELDDFPGMTMAECNLGIAYMKLGLLKLSRRCFVQYLDNSGVLMDEMGIAYACSNLGVLSKMIAQEEYRKLEGEDRASKAKNKEGMQVFVDYVLKAITYFEQHLEIVERQSDIEKQGRVYNHIGSCYEMLRKYNQAIFCHTKRLDIVRTTGDHNAEICSLCYLGNCLRATGKLDEAIENYSLGLELCQATNDKLSESKILLNLGTTCQLMGQNQKAIEWYTLYYCMCVEAGDVVGQTRASGILAELYHCFGQEFQAHEYFKKLADNLKAMGDNVGVATANHYITKSKQAMEKQRIRHKTKLNKKGPVKKPDGRMDAYMRASVEGSLDKLHSSKTIGKAEKKGVDDSKMGTWSPGLKSWYHTRLTTGGTGNTGTWSHNARKGAGLVIRNRHSYHETLQLSSSQSNQGTVNPLYRSQGMSDKLNTQAELDVMKSSARHSFYTLGDFMEPVHHRVTSDEGGSVTEYEDIEETTPWLMMPSAFGSSRHIKSLKDAGKTLLNMSKDNNNAGSPIEQNVETEWLQWLDIHTVGQNNVTDSNELKENKPPTQTPPRSIIASITAPVSVDVPQLVPIRDLNAPPPPPPPPLPPQRKASTISAITVPVNKVKRSFRGLSIFGSTNNSSSQENLLQDPQHARSTSSVSTTSAVSKQSKHSSVMVDTSLVMTNRGIGEVPLTFRESQVI